MRIALPDPEISLRDASDFILDSKLGRMALGFNRYSHFPVFIRDLISAIYRLVGSCHLSEFTDHGLHHLCSLSDRISNWTCAPIEGKSYYLLDLLKEYNPEEHSENAAVLLIATLIHDIGMLSQKAEDLDVGNPMRSAKGRMDLSEWVRKTHVERIPRLVRRLFNSVPEYEIILESEMMRHAFCVAQAHQKWPWEQDFIDLQGINPALAAVIAVSDLLDEDSNRCDTLTLIQHREGSVENKAHWIRHTLTQNRVILNEGEVFVKMVRPPGTDSQIASFFTILRNHYRLVLLYTESLSLIGAGVLNIFFDPQSGMPKDEAESLNEWQKLSGFHNQKALLYHLLCTFFPESRLERNKIPEETIKKLLSLRLEEIDLDFFYNIQGKKEIRSPYEQEFYALFI